MWFVRCAGACATCGRFLGRGGLLAGELLLHVGVSATGLGAAFCKIYGRYNGQVCPYIPSLSKMLSDMFQDNCGAVY